MPPCTRRCGRRETEHELCFMSFSRGIAAVVIGRGINLAPWGVARTGLLRCGGESVNSPLEERGQCSATRGPTTRGLGSGIFSCLSLGRILPLMRDNTRIALVRHTTAVHEAFYNRGWTLFFSEAPDAPPPGRLMRNSPGLYVVLQN